MNYTHFTLNFDPITFTMFGSTVLKDREMSNEEKEAFNADVEEGLIPCWVPKQ